MRFAYSVSRLLLDGLIGDATGGLSRRDDGGRRAAAGRAHEGLLSELLADPFFTLPPPRDTPAA